MEEGCCVDELGDLGEPPLGREDVTLGGLRIGRKVRERSGVGVAKDTKGRYRGVDGRFCVF